MEILGVILAFIGGVMNGSYPAPKNYCKAWQDGHIWSIFSFCTFLLIPLALISCNSDALDLLSNKALGILIFSGFIFSLGMACFTFSLKKIGLGPSFSLNIILGTSLGTLTPLFAFHSNACFSNYALLNYCGVLLFILSIIFLYRSISSDAHTIQKKEKVYGVVLGALSGVLTSVQSFAYNYAINELGNGGLSQILNKLVIWGVFFISCFPIFFLIHLIKSREKIHIFNRFKAHNLKLVGAMSVLYYLSIVLFSWATNYISVPVAWPIFMTSIVLTTNFWSTKLKELHGIKKKYYIAYFSTTLIAFLFFASSMNLGV